MRETLAEGIDLYLGDCLEVLKTLGDSTVDSIVTDPPAGIAFMNKSWDKNKGGRTEWISWMNKIATECLRVVKPGGHALVWAIPKTSHWTATAWEDAEWETRDKIYHVFGSGFPKNHDISKAIDKQSSSACPHCEGTGTLAPFAMTFEDWYAAAKDYGGTREEWERLSEQEAETSCQVCNGTGEIKGVEREVVGIAKGTGKQNPAWNGTEGGRSQNSLKPEYPQTTPATDAAKQWEGWGTALKPAVEEWILFRKPFSGTVAQNVLQYGTGGLNVDGCRITNDDYPTEWCDCED